MIEYSTVIGRQGEMINKLQAESGARIQVAPGDNVHLIHVVYIWVLYRWV